jgi:hypothetical protein
MLMGFRSSDLTQFRAGIDAMGDARQNNHGGLFRKLATLALVARNPPILEAVLEVYHSQMEWQFDAQFDSMKHKGSDPEMFRIIEKSGYKSPIEPGKKFSDLHPLDYM